MKTLVAGLLFAAAVSSHVSSRAQDYPARPVKIVAPNPPGGGFDLVARVLAQQLTQQLGQQFIVENRTGAGTLIGTRRSHGRRRTATRCSSAASAIWRPMQGSTKRCHTIRSPTSCPSAWW
jgi:tripartite-type tricarboxylate transporter receptor subunit TctC